MCGVSLLLQVLQSEGIEMLKIDSLLEKEDHKIGLQIVKDRSDHYNF